ncbi:MAG: hypothetical protein F6K42_23375, partial [Leptolyngbya sp. SIO1D8]|nr:hypothetical protein [Leptolyngbya sp. SIO1D8]
MALLNRFLRLLEWLEQATDVIEFLTTPAGIAIAACLLSYQALLLAGCDSPTAAILASTAALT